MDVPGERSEDRPTRDTRTKDKRGVVAHAALPIVTSERW
jgi:hypothetical protein